MATTAKKTAAKKTAHKTRAAKKGPHKQSKALKKDMAKLKASLNEDADGDEDEELEWAEVKKAGAKKSTKKYAKLDLKPIKGTTKTVGKGKKTRKVKAKKLSASQTLNMLVENTGLARKDVRLVMEEMSNIVKAAIMPGGIGGVVIPGVGAFMRKTIAAKKMPAVKKGTIIERRNPRTGEVTRLKHPGQKAYVKPARSKVRAIPLSSVRRALNGTE